MSVKRVCEALVSGDLTVRRSGTEREVMGWLSFCSGFDRRRAVELSRRAPTACRLRRAARRTNRTRRPQSSAARATRLALPRRPNAATSRARIAPRGVRRGRRAPSRRARTARTRSAPRRRSRQAYWTGASTGGNAPAARLIAAAVLGRASRNVSVVASGATSATPPGVR